MNRDSFIASLVAAGFSRAEAVEEWEYYSEGLMLDQSDPHAFETANDEPSEP